MSPTPSPTMPPDMDSLEALQWNLVHTALELACALEEAIQDAPLRERANALGVMIDRLIKLQQWFDKVGRGEDDQPAEKVVRIEYRYPDGSIHNAPPWANDDYEIETSFPDSGVWPPLREDGNREIAESGLRDEP